MGISAAEMEKLDSELSEVEKSLAGLVDENQANFGENSDTIEQVRALMKALEAGKLDSPGDLVKGAALQVLDLTERTQPYLTESSKLDLQNKAPRQLTVTEDNKVYQAIYFSCIVKTGNEERGLQEMAKIINDLSQRGLIHSVLAPPSAIQLAMTSSVQKSAVFFFPLVPHYAVKDCEALYKGFFTLEGGMGHDLEDMSVPLTEGEFIADIRVSHFASMVQKDFNLEKAVQNEIEQYLAILPKGTEVRSLTKLAIMDLSVPYEVKFYNPILQRVKKVQLDYVRDFARFADSIHEFNLITGIRFFGEDGKNLYRFND